MYVKIIKVCALTVRNYTDRNGQPQIFKSKGFLLSNGNNMLYAEATSTYAEKLEARTFDLTQWHVVDINISVREYTDKDGVSRCSNEITLTRINNV